MYINPAKYYQFRKQIKDGDFVKYPKTMTKFPSCISIGSIGPDYAIKWKAYIDKSTELEGFTVRNKALDIRTDNVLITVMY